jgi:protein-S-isoprenylcysteine O-methyltransferase Ste14
MPPPDSVDFPVPVRTEETCVNGGKRLSAVSRLRAFELRVPPLALVVIFAAVMWLGAHVAPFFLVVIPWRAVIAVCLAAIGISVSLAGVAAFRRVRTTVNPYRPDATAVIVRTGVYRYSRNPMYLGFLFVLGGWAVLLSNGFAIALLPLFVAYVSRFQIAPEERWLMEKFGEEFAAYRKSTRRWL